jgi:dTMP kinase
MKLFVVEGVDGAGKSTQISLLKDYLLRHGYQCEYLHFPRTEAPYFGELIARFLRGEFGTLAEVNPWLVAMLYAGDRKDASGIIGDWLKNGRIVLLDRYTYSNIAYQCAKLNDRQEQEKLLEWIKELEFVHFAIPRPDLNIFLDVPFSFTEKKLSDQRTGESRSYLKGTRDIHEESLLFQRKVRDMYIRIAESDERLCVVDCSDRKKNMLPPGAVFNLIINKMSERNLI